MNTIDIAMLLNFAEHSGFSGMFYGSTLFKSGIENIDFKTTRNTAVSEERKKQLLSFFKSIAQECQHLNLLASNKTAIKIIDLLHSSNVNYGNLDELYQELFGRLFDETQSLVCFSIELNKRHFISGHNLFGEQVAQAFPSAEQDIKHASTCLAFEEWTACVFHSMRVLEIGLNILAKKFNVTFDHTNWQNIIDQIEKVIKEIDKTKWGNEWKTEEKYYSEVALQFRYFKNAWRNYVMHARDTYDEEHAMRIFDYVKQFMIHLATRLKEDSVWMPREF